MQCINKLYLLLLLPIRCCLSICWVVYLERNMIYGNGINVCLKMWYILWLSDGLCLSRFQAITSGIWYDKDILYWSDGFCEMKAKYWCEIGIWSWITRCWRSLAWLVMWHRQILGTLGSKRLTSISWLKLWMTIDNLWNIFRLLIGYWLWQNHDNKYETCVISWDASAYQ